MAPRSGAYKDTVVAQLALQAHFAIADDLPSNKNLSDLGRLMFHHVANAGACAFQGEYFEACKRFARTN